ncbi:MAG: hypothetical protein K0S37_3667 [Microbacterium sp.]|jgi:hypothetical protein|nr:hypothetical protein [Microbacterium sp.]
MSLEYALGASVLTAYMFIRLWVWAKTLIR